ncbi:hypothetical protein Tco_0011464 [Tanacetum coccineum]
MQKQHALSLSSRIPKRTLGTTIITCWGESQKAGRCAYERGKGNLITDILYDDAERVEKEIDMDSLLALENASLAEQQSSFVTAFQKIKDSGSLAKSPAQVSSRSVKTYTRASKGSASEDTSSRWIFHHISLPPGGITHSSANQDIHADIFVTPGNMPISTGSGTIPAGVSVPTGSSTFPAGSEQVPPVSTSIDKGKAQLAELERQQEELFRQDELLARQLDQDFDIPAQQKKRQQEVQAAVMHYTDDDWITIMAKIQANKELSRTLIGSNLPEGDFAIAIVEMVDRKRRQIANKRLKLEGIDLMIPSWSKSDFSDNLLSKNQSLALSYKKGWTMTYLKSLTSKRLGDELEQPSSKRLKPIKVEATSDAMEDTGAQLPIPSEDVQTSKESENLRIPIETGDPDAKHKMCLKYASDKEDDSDCDTLVPFYAVIDWELLPTVQLVKFLKKQIADSKRAGVHDRTARISVLPIEPNLAERARISAINLDDYQLDPVTPPPSPSSPFSMAAYQRMIAETDPTQREEALTAYGTGTGQNSVPIPETALTVCTTRLRGQLHTILEDMDRYPNACLEELEAFMTLWDVKPRVEESSLETLSVDELITQLRQMCEDAEDRASNAQEEARQKRKEALEEVIQRIYRNNN